MIQRGFPDEFFISPILDVLRCSLCGFVMRNPTKSGCSHDHAFCLSCISHILQIESKCPSCPEEITRTNELIPIPFTILQSFIDVLQVKCIHGCSDGRGSEPVFEYHCDEKTNDSCRRSARNEFCSWQGEFRDLQRHLESSCELEPMSCPNNGCNVSLPLAIFQKEHVESCLHQVMVCGLCEDSFPWFSAGNHVNSCVKREVDCPNDCGQRIVFDTFSEHQQSSCINQMLACPYQEILGCTFHGYRGQVESHLNDPSVHILQTIKILEDTSQVISQLQNSVIHLSQKMAVLENRLASSEKYVSSFCWEVNNFSSHIAYQKHVSPTFDAFGLTLRLEIHSFPHPQNSRMQLNIRCTNSEVLGQKLQHFFCTLCFEGGDSKQVKKYSNIFFSSERNIFGGMIDAREFLDPNFSSDILIISLTLSKSPI